MTDAGVLPAGLTVVPGRSTRATRYWLDTFDRRLLARGVEMWLLPGRGPSPARVVVTGPQPLAGEWSGPVPPEVVRRDELAEPVAGAIGGLLDIRALLPLISAPVVERFDRVVDAEQKTLCRVRVQEAGPVRVVGVQALRGYEDEAAGVATALGTGEQSLLYRLLEHEGRAETPGSRPAGAGLDPKTPAPEGVARIVGRLLATVEENLPGTLARYDDEFLHDLRVAVRRARSVLKIARDFVAPAPAQTLGVELKWLGDMTTPARDLDVHIQDVPRMARHVDADLRAALDPFVDLLVRNRDRAYEDLRAAVRSTRYRRLMEDAPGLLADLAPPLDGEGALVTTAELAQSALQKAFGRVVKRGRRLTPASPDEDVHDLRKRAKELRYGLEFFAELMGPERSQLVRDLKELQDVLGTFNDSVVQLAFLRACAEDLHAGGASARTLLALGEISADIARHGVRARSELGDRVDALVRWGRSGRFTGLLTGG